MRGPKQLVGDLLKSIDITVARYSRIENRIADLQRAADDIDFLRTIDSPELLWKVLRYLPKSKAQLRQDLFVLSQLNFKQNGFFVEFGATDGIDLSNTHLLESEFDWQGILAEPAIRWHDALAKNRSATIDTRCVWRASDLELTFNEVSAGEFSTISVFSGADMHRDRRKRGTKYPVATISLLDLLKRHEAPRIIDYLSIDTEGSEFDILDAFNFSEYQFRVITCEHNWTANREKIFKLLSRHGYSRVLQEISWCDDWYIHSQRR